MPHTELDPNNNCGKCTGGKALLLSWSPFMQGVVPTQRELHQVMVMIQKLTTASLPPIFSFFDLSDKTKSSPSDHALFF